MTFGFPRKGLHDKGKIPLYVRIDSLVRNRILNGELQPGDKLPTEENLVEQFGVSQITIRAALASLERDGLVIRSRAKGTFVAPGVPESRKFVITNEVVDILKDADRYEVKDVSVKVVKVAETRNARMVREFFGLTNDEPICMVTRTRLWKGSPMYYLENILPPSMALNLSVKDLNKKRLLSLLKERIGLTLGRGEMYIEAVPADPDVAEILSMQSLAPLILRQLCYWFPDGAPFEIVNCYMRPDRFKYKVEINMSNFNGL
jgi:GntR family transcriptional regulator